MSTRADGSLTPSLPHGDSLGLGWRQTPTGGSMATVDGQKTLESLLCESNATFYAILCVFISDTTFANLPCLSHGVTRFRPAWWLFFLLRCNTFLLVFLGLFKVEVRRKSLSRCQKLSSTGSWLNHARPRSAIRATCARNLNYKNNKHSSRYVTINKLFTSYLIHI